ncbi:hypothetical protein PWG14_25315 [Chromobacterium amazonense]|uniref:hypothetical protein n=1 Tax=Chromobacterium amazonense TaxID=1382803 RepID=UPI00237E16A1|nr:hypothetical protein [Chromobacterium amazonense]MDE1715791.1 hypothetical protein [Chromobacterium amazonense]
MLTVLFGLCVPRVERIEVWGGSRITRIHTGFCRINIWRGAALETLNTAVFGISRDPEWLALNAPAMRHARRKAAAKERAQIRKLKQTELDRARARAAELEDKLIEARNDNFALRRTIAHLTREDAA